MNKTINIAFTGAYEIANYGDHLFPIVFKYELERHNISYNLFLFSVFNGKQAFDTNNAVYALEDMEELHQRYNFDVIIVGGGELIHLSSSMQLLNYSSKDYVDYKIFETWTIPSIMGLKYNIPVLWNAPGGQYKFPNTFHKLIQLLCRPVSYLSVRNYTTRSSLAECGIPFEQIFHIPDTAFEISRVYSQEFLLPIKNSTLNFSEPYIVFHANRYISDSDILQIIGYLNSYYEKGFKIVLLPLAYTHNDQDTLTKLNSYAENRFVTFDRMLSLEEILSILAFSELYVGISFHGAVTSIAYNRRAIIYDYIGSEKSMDLFKLVNKSDCYINDITKLPSKIEEVISQQPDYPLSDIYSRLDSHFDKLMNLIDTLPTTDYSNDFKEFSEFIEIIAKDTFDKLFAINNDKKIINDAKEFINKQTNELIQLRKYSSSLEIQLFEAQNYIKELTNSYNGLVKDFEHQKYYIASLENKSIKNTTLYKKIRHIIKHN